MTFYAQIPPITRFEEGVDLACYRPAPSDWWCVVSDVRGSTRAIEEGRYQDVNLAGAASITAVLNALDRAPIPYVFGGDGAVLLIPPEGRARVRPELVRTRRLVQQAYGLDLRLGMVPIADLEADGLQVLVARYQLSPGNDLALFQGGGVQEAERRVKADRRYRIEEEGDDRPPDLAGLSCRWDPLGSSRGTILSLLVVARHQGSANAVYAAVMGEIAACVGDLAGSGPMRLEKLHMSWTLVKARREAQLAVTGTPSPLRTALVWLRGWLVRGMLASPIPLFGFDGARYIGEYRTNTDTRKLDDALRMVLDCTAGQIAAIRECLERRHRAGELFYGLHESRSALLTCLVFSPTANRHVHFVDGGDGGYASAASQLKRQMARLDGRDASPAVPSN